MPDDVRDSDSRVCASGKVPGYCWVKTVTLGIGSNRTVRISRCGRGLGSRGYDPGNCNGEQRDSDQMHETVRKGKSPKLLLLFGSVYDALPDPPPNSFP